MAIKLLNANCLLTVDKARNINGILIANNKIENGIFVSSVRISEIPVTPPSINELGKRKPFNPNPAEAIPNPIKTKSRKSFRNLLNVYFLVFEEFLAIDFRVCFIFSICEYLFYKISYNLPDN